MKIEEMTRMFIESRRRGTDGAKKRCQETTIEIYKRNLGVFQDFLLSSAPGGSIVDYENMRRGTILALIDWIQAKERAGDWSVSTGQQFWRTLKSFFTWVEKDEDCVEEGLKSMNKYLPVIGKPPRREFIPMTQDLKAFRNAYDTHKVYSFRDYVIFSVLLETGIRVGELCGLKLDDIFLPQGLMVVDGKTGKRAVPITSSCSRLLKAWLRRREDTTMGRTSPYLFISKYQEKLTEHGVTQMFRKMRIANGLAKITPHTLRHSFASYSLRNGVGIETVRNILGHTSLTTTSKYLHMAKIAGKEMAAELEKHSLLKGL